MDHVFHPIPGWFQFASAYDLAVAEASDGAVFVEIGCHKGRSAAYLGVQIVNSGKRIALHCVDHWDDHEEPELRRIFEANLAPVVCAGLDLTVHAGESDRVAAAFAEGSVDFVWLDAGHRFEEVRADLLAWLPKLRPSAVIGGDDWCLLGVSSAVREILGQDVELGSDDCWPWWRHRRKAFTSR